MTGLLSVPYALPDDAVERFSADGFVKLAGVLDAATIARYEPAVTAGVIDLNTLDLPMEQRTTYQRAFLQVTNLWRHSDLVRELVFSERLARIAAELMGVRRVRLYHDQALYKEPGGGKTPWHADQYYWPLSTDRTCTVWIPMQATTMEMGPLSLAVGSHRFEHGRDLPISDESEAELQRSLEAQHFPVFAEAFELGDVSYHQGWTFHRADPNQSAAPRRVMTVIYMDADITVTEPTNDHQRADLAAWMPGAVIGRSPDTELNPVLADRG